MLPRKLIVSYTKKNFQARIFFPVQSQSSDSSTNTLDRHGCGFYEKSFRLSGSRTGKANFDLLRADAGGLRKFLA